MTDLAEIKSLFDEGMQTANDLRGQVDELKSTVSDLETKLNRPGMGGGTARVSDAETKMVNFLRTGDGLEQKEMTIGNATSGGHSVPEEIDRVLQDQLVEISPVRSVANVVTTMSSDYKKLIGTRGASSGWVGETDTRTETNTPEMEAVIPTMGEIYAYPSMSRWVFEDSSFNLNTWLRENVAEEFAVQEGAAFISGNGTNKPTGFLTGTPVTTADTSRAFGTLQYVPTGSAGDFGANPFDNLVDLKNALKPSYRAGAVWMMNSTTAALLQKVKDADGRPIWNENVRVGQPSTLLGYPVVEAEDMPDAAADSFGVAFGNFQRGYIIADRGPFTVVRDEVTRPGYIKLYLARRTGGKVSDSNAIKLLKFSAS